MKITARTIDGGNHHPVLEAERNSKIVEEITVRTPKKKKRYNPRPRISAPGGKLFEPVRK